jgi:hypothetical protein
VLSRSVFVGWGIHSVILGVEAGLGIPCPLRIDTTVPC